MVWVELHLALVHVRVKIIIFVMAVFCLQYAAYLYVLMNVRPLKPEYMFFWRESTFTSYVAYLLYMSLRCSSSIEVNMVKTGILFFILVQFIKLLDSMNLYKNAPVSLIIASLVTMAYGLLVYRNAKKHGILDE